MPCHTGLLFVFEHGTHSAKRRSFRPRCLSRPIPDTRPQAGSAAKTLHRIHEPRWVAEVAEGNIVFSPDGSMPLPLTEPCHLDTLQFKRSTQSIALAARQSSSVTRHSHSLPHMEALHYCIPAFCCRYLQLRRRWQALTPPTRCGPKKADRLFLRVGSRVANGWNTEPYFDGCRKQTTRKTEYVRHARTLLGSHEAAHNPGAFFTTQFEY